MDRDRRESYRVDTSAFTFLRLDFLDAEGESVGTAVLQDINEKGAAIGFDFQEAPKYQIGEHHRVRLSFSSLMPPLELDCLIHWKFTDGKEVGFGLAFESDTPIADSVPAICRNFFNRRHSPRVRPDAESPVPVELAGLRTGRCYRGSLSNLSIEGMEVGFDLETAMGLEDEERFEARLAFPEGPVVAIEALSCGCRPEGVRLYVGLQFHPGTFDTPGLERVREFVEARVGTREFRPLT